MSDLISTVIIKVLYDNEDFDVANKAIIELANRLNRILFKMNRLNQLIIPIMV